MVDRFIVEHYKFQFHKGTIKTNFSMVSSWLISAFQFHKGTIKTHGINVFGELQILFQFHKGTIKTKLKAPNHKNMIISIP